LPRGLLVAQTSETGSWSNAGPVVRTPPQPVEESGLAGLASFEVVPGDFVCHAEGRGFESHHALRKTPVNRGFLATVHPMQGPVVRGRTLRSGAGEAEAIVDGDRETAVALLLRVVELVEANQRLEGRVAVYLVREVVVHARLLGIWW
jgi:hypothetical protein